MKKLMAASKKQFSWRDKNWSQRGILVMTIVLVIVLSTHPELRLFLPLIDVLGLDLLLIITGSQLLDYVRPLLNVMRSYFLPPYAICIHSLILFFMFNIGLHSQHKHDSTPMA